MTPLDRVADDPVRLEPRREAEAALGIVLEAHSSTARTLSISGATRSSPRHAGRR